MLKTCDIEYVAISFEATYFEKISHECFILSISIQVIVNFSIDNYWQIINCEDVTKHFRKTNMDMIMKTKILIIHSYFTGKYEIEKRFFKIQKTLKWHVFILFQPLLNFIYLNFF